MRVNIIHDCEGAAVISYALLMMMLAVVCMTSLQVLEGAFSDRFQQVADREMAHGSAGSGGGVAGGDGRNGKAITRKPRRGPNAGSVNAGSWPPA